LADFKITKIYFCYKKRPSFLVSEVQFKNALLKNRLQGWTRRLGKNNTNTLQNPCRKYNSTKLNQALMQQTLTAEKYSSFKKKEVARGGGERTRVLLISFLLSFSPLYR
jgi:hypothetical protein